MSTTQNLINSIDPSNKSCTLTPMDRLQYTLVFNFTSHNYAPRPPDEEVKISFVFFFSLILLVGVITNILVVAWITRGKVKKSSIDVHIVSVSIADLLSVLTSIPLNTALLWLDGNWASVGDESHVKYLCKAGIYFQNVSLCISSLTLVIIAIDRYIALCHPFLHYKYASYKRRITAVMTAIIWLLGLLIAVRDLVTVRLSKSIDELPDDPDKVGEFLKKEIIYVADYDFYDTYSYIIPAAHPSKCQEFVYYRVCLEVEHYRNNVPLFFVLVYVVPVIVMVFCYGSIIHRLWVRKPVGDSSHLSEVDKKMNKASTRQTIVMMIVLITAFGLLWLPYWCKKIYESLRPLPLNELAVFDSVDQSFIMFTYLSWISTPIIYMLLDRNFRKVVKQKFVALGLCIVDPMINCLDNNHQSTTAAEAHDRHSDDDEKKSTRVGPEAARNGEAIGSNLHTGLKP